MLGQSGKKGKKPDKLVWRIVARYWRKLEELKIWEELWIFASSRNQSSVGLSTKIVFSPQLEKKSIKLLPDKTLFAYLSVPYNLQRVAKKKKKKGLKTLNRVRLWQLRRMCYRWWIVFCWNTILLSIVTLLLIKNNLKLKDNSSLEETLWRN